MEISENLELKDRFLESLRESHEERIGIHVSDLIYCLREAFYRRAYPKPATETQLMFFLDGARRHIALQSLAGVESEVEVSGYGVTGTVDMKDHVPIEFKSTRAPKALPDHYFSQLGYYCVLSNVDNGILVIQRINNREKPFEFYDVSFSQQELEVMRREIIDKQKLLSDAIQQNTAKNLTLTSLEWKCKFCLHTVECDMEKEEP